MASFRGEDYDYLFTLGQKLYYSDSTLERKAIATVLMAMSEYARGQQVPWPNIPPKYRHLVTYPPVPETDRIMRVYPKSAKG